MQFIADLAFQPIQPGSHSRFGFGRHFKHRHIRMNLADAADYVVANQVEPPSWQALIEDLKTAISVRTRVAKGYGDSDEGHSYFLSVLS